jgi:phage gp36-like protein
MSYITVDELKQYLGDVYLSAYINVNTQLIDDTILQSDIDAATNIIDLSVMELYNTTITGAKSLSVLNTISRQLVNYFAHQRYDASQVPDSVIEANKDANIKLSKIANGTLKLTDETQDPRGSSFTFSFNSANSDGTGRKIFDRDSMSGY